MTVKNVCIHEKNDQRIFEHLLLVSSNICMFALEHKKVFRPPLVYPTFTTSCSSPKSQQITIKPISVIMSDDLGKLPGDDDRETKRKGLRRLRKAHRASLRQETHDEPSPSADVKRKKASSKKHRAPATTDRGDDDQGIGAIQDASIRGKGRQWVRRKWKAEGLPDLARVILASVTAAGDLSINFSTLFDSTSVKDATPKEGEAPESASSGMAGNKTQAVAKSKKGDKKGKAKEKVSAHKEVADEETPEAVEARKKEERRVEVRAWAEELRGKLEEETYLTTAHRAVVAARDSFIAELTEKTKVVSKSNAKILHSGTAKRCAYYNRLVNI